MTKYECAVVTAYTGISMLQGEDVKYLYVYLSDIAKRTVYTHELLSVTETYKEKIKKDFIDICKNSSE